MINIEDIFTTEEGLNIASLKTLLYDLASSIQELENADLINTVYNEEKNLNVDLLENEDGLKYVLLNNDIKEIDSVYVYCDVFEDGEFKSVPVSSTFIFSVSKNIIVFNHKFNHLKYSKMFVTYNI